MTLHMFLNERSHACPAPSLAQARERMGRLVDTFVACEPYICGQRASLLCMEPWLEIEVGAQYRVVQWLNDHKVEREKRQYLLALLDRSIAPMYRHSESVECRSRGERALAMTAAWRAEGLTVSFASEPCWGDPWLTVDVQQLCEATGELVVRSDERLRHASEPAHVETHADWIQKLCRAVPRDGLDLWDKRTQLFPHLDWCSEVRKHLSEFRRGDPAFVQVLGRLEELEKFFASWTGKPIGPESLSSKCTSESQATLDKFPEERTFTRADSSPQLFRWHLRFTPEPGRIYFDGDAASRKGVIGCITRRHLPTKKYPT